MRVLWKMLLGAVTIVAVVVAALANAQSNQSKPRMIGNWMVSVDQDRFSDAPQAMAITMQHGAILAVRCLERSLSVAIRNVGVIGGLTPGDIFSVAFRGSPHAVIQTMGDAVNDLMVEVMVTDEMRNDLITSAEYAFRLKFPASQIDVIFDAGSAQEALQPVYRACPAKK